MVYLYLLGSTPNLSLAELQAVYPKEQCQKIASNVISLKLGNELDPEKELSKLGGTVKIAENFETVSRNDLTPAIISLLKKRVINNKITFGISRYGSAPIGNIKSYPKEIKRKLELEGIKVRFILPLTGECLSSVQVQKQKVVEIIVVNFEGSLILAETKAVQDFEEWGKRDYKRPFADPKSGMLPPKIARIMVNLALSDIKRPTTNDQRPIILDPFCGMGTIGAEALLNNFWVILGDLDPKTLEKAEKNLNWICQIYGINKENYQTILSNACNISQKIPPHTIDAVVTEPFLGPVVNFYKGKPMINDRPITEGRILFIFNELEKLYSACFADWQKILKKSGKIIVIFPSFRLGLNEYFMKNIIDSCEKLGYNVLDGPYDYGHPQAIIRRNIYVFTLKSA